MTDVHEAGPEGGSMTEPMNTGRDMLEDFDVTDPVWSTPRFEAVLDELVEKCPVAHSTVGTGYRVFNRHRDVRRCAQDWKTFSSAGGYMVNRAEGTPLILPEESDPPYHNLWRRALNPFFDPKSVAGFEPEMRRVANELIDRFIERGSCDFVADFAAHLPGHRAVPLRAPGPRGGHPGALRGHRHRHVRPARRARPGLRRRRAVLRRPAAPALGGAAARRRHRRDRRRSAAARRHAVPWEHKVATLLDVVFGGLATTTHVMSGALWHLATHPDDRRALIEDPSLVPQAVEEFVRLFPPVFAVARQVTTDVEVAGEQLTAGEWVLLNFASASRDPEATSDPTKLDIRREEVVHSAFGVGPHRCLGSHLARLELRVTVEEFLRRIPEFSVRPGSAPEFECAQLRTMKNVQLVWPDGEA